MMDAICSFIFFQCLSSPSTLSQTYKKKVSQMKKFSRVGWERRVWAIADMRGGFWKILFLLNLGHPPLGNEEKLSSEYLAHKDSLQVVFSEIQGGARAKQKPETRTIGTDIPRTDCGAGGNARTNSKN